MSQVSEAILRSEAMRRALGISMFVPADPARAHLRMLKGAPYYMSNRRIAEISGLCESNLCQIIRGKRGEQRGYEVVNEIHRDTEAALLGVRPEENCPARGGGHVEPTGARRRLQALIFAGYPMKYLSELMGWGHDPQPIHRFVTGKSGRVYVFHSTHLKACEAFAKLENVPPEDMGFTKVAIGRARTSARKNGYTPAHCWDEDTIDDPEALPEWTGACGTQQGYRIHVREEISMCAPCKKAQGGELTFSPEKFKAVRLQKGLGMLALARMIDSHESTIRYWEDGRSAPRRGHLLDRVLSALDVTLEDITESEDG